MVKLRMRLVGSKLNLADMAISPTWRRGCEPTRTSARLRRFGCSRCRCRALRSRRRRAWPLRSRRASACTPRGGGECGGPPGSPAWLRGATCRCPCGRPSPSARRTATARPTPPPACGPRGRRRSQRGAREGCGGARWRTRSGRRPRSGRAALDARGVLGAHLKGVHARREQSGLRAAACCRARHVEPVGHGRE